MSTHTLLTAVLGTALFAAACGAPAPDGALDATVDGALDRTPGPVAATPAARTSAPAARPAPSGPVYRDVTIPAGTALVLSLTTAVASDTSQVEDMVEARLTQPVMVAGSEILPSGTTLAGAVTEAEGSGRVKGRALVAFRFTSMRTGREQYDVQTKTVSMLAAATKSEDAVKIGIGAGAGAVIGGLLGGKDGATKDAVVGGGAGTGVVLATKGDEVRLAPGTDVSTELTSPFTMRVRVS